MALQDKTKSWPSCDWPRLLTAFATAVSSHRGRPALLEELWARRTGKTWKALVEFPNRLERLADEVDCLNIADPVFYPPRRCRGLSRTELQRIALDYWQLSAMIRFYAETRRERNAAVLAQTPRIERSEILFYLSILVKSLTGAPHDQEVSELLNAAANALGETIQFDAGSIAQARSRRKKRPKRT